MSIVRVLSTVSLTEVTLRRLHRDTQGGFWRNDGNLTVHNGTPAHSLHRQVPEKRDVEERAHILIKTFGSKGISSLLNSAF